MRNNSFQYMVSKHFEENRTLYLFTTILFLVGIIFGAIIVNSLTLTQKHDLSVYLMQFFGQVHEGDLASSAQIFSQSFIHYAKYFALIWILGLSIIGLPIILILLFVKGIVVGFTVGFLVSQLGLSGFFLSFGAIMPQNFLLVPAFIIAATASTSFCLKMIRQQFMKGNHLPIFPQFIRYSLLILCLGAVVAISSVFEAYISPSFMKLVLTYTM